jgi:hypothetical protein
LGIAPSRSAGLRQETRRIMVVLSMKSRARAHLDLDWIKPVVDSTRLQTVKNQAS